LDQQILSSESQRRSAYSTELFSILKDVADQKPVANKGTLSPELIARIVVLTRSAAPFYYIDNSNNGLFKIDKPLSPERGQLLVGLLKSGVDMASIIEAKADFRASDLRAADLDGAVLPKIDLSSSNLAGANISDAQLQGSTLVQADFTRTG